MDAIGLVDAMIEGVGVDEAVRGGEPRKIPCRGGRD